MTLLVLSLGSNIEREKNIRFALDALEAEYGEIRISPVYETRAVGFDGPDFLNLVAVLETSSSLQKISDAIRRIESRAGRVRAEKSMQSRELDIDILLFGEAVLYAEGHNIPRHEIEQAAYVLRPLADVLPNMRHPVSGQRFEDIYRESHADAPGVVPIDFVY